MKATNSSVCEAKPKQVSNSQIQYTGFKLESPNSKVLKIKVLKLQSLNTAGKHYEPGTYEDSKSNIKLTSQTVSSQKLNASLHLSKQKTLRLTLELRTSLLGEHSRDRVTKFRLWNTCICNAENICSIYAPGIESGNLGGAVTVLYKLCFWGWPSDSAGISPPSLPLRFPSVILATQVRGYVMDTQTKNKLYVRKRKPNTFLPTSSRQLKPQ